MEGKEMARAETPRNEAPAKEDVWISTMCRRCQSECGIRIHRIDGVAVKIEA
jgi:hypothetical protein